MSDDPELLAELVAAKQAYRDDPSEENKRRKADAVAAVREHRARERAGRAGNAVGGDATVAGQEG
jgi:hypothetical protein